VLLYVEGKGTVLTDASGSFTISGVTAGQSIKVTVQAGSALGAGAKVLSLNSGEFSEVLLGANTSVPAGCSLTSHAANLQSFLEAVDSIQKMGISNVDKLRRRAKARKQAGALERSLLGRHRAVMEASIAYPAVTQICDNSCSRMALGGIVKMVSRRVQQLYAVVSRSGREIRAFQLRANSFSDVHERKLGRFLNRARRQLRQLPRHTNTCG
jgi:hypothetical protein